MTEKKERNWGGRPTKYKNKEELQVAIDKYFAECEIKAEPLTITGLALAVEMSRQGLINYEERDEFFDTIKSAKTKIENYAEKLLLKGANSAGAIFALKNYGWADKQQVETTDLTKQSHEDWLKENADKLKDK